MARDWEIEYKSKDPTTGSRERDRSPLRANFDLTSNPETVSSRIFVGSLTSDITRKSLEDHFSRWGNVVGVTLTKNKFGFIQFEREIDAQDCLAQGYTTTLNGVEINIKPARLGPSQMSAPPPVPGLGGPTPSSSVAWGSSRGGGYSATREHPPPRDDDYYDSYYRTNSKGRDGDAMRYGDYYRDYYDRPSGASAPESDYYRGKAETSHPPSRPYESSSSIYSRTPAEPLDPLDPMRNNDVEIVVPNKQQRAYAESIEAQLKRMNLLVDLLFPPPDITPARVVSDLSARKCLYVVFATAENEKHNSLSVNILQGEPQEHRNMPVDDALRLIHRHFEDYVKLTRLRNAREVLPRDVRILLIDMLEMRPLSMGDLDKLIKYLRERQNTLVDDQIEQKRETAGTQTSVVAGSMAVTYPGYNYIATSVQGPAAGTSHTSVASTWPQGLLPGSVPSAAVAPPPSVAQPSPVSIVSTPTAVAAAAIAAYPATAYSGLHTTGLFGAYNVGPQVASHHMQSSPHFIPGTTGPPPKQSDLQERILNLMKGQGAVPTPSSEVHMPSGVPPPTAVPPPSVVPAPRMEQPIWMPQQQTRVGESDSKLQGSQAAYNPWSM